VELCLETGADRDRCDNDGHSAIMWAGRYGHTAVVESIMQVPYIRSMLVDGGRGAHTWVDPEKLTYTGWIDMNRVGMMYDPIQMGYAHASKLLPPVASRPPPQAYPYMSYVKPKQVPIGVQMAKQRGSKFGAWSPLTHVDASATALWDTKVIKRRLARETNNGASGTNGGNAGDSGDGGSMVAIGSVAPAHHVARTGERGVDRGGDIGGGSGRRGGGGGRGAQKERKLPGHTIANMSVADHLHKARYSTTR
jgi:hypothetical protein